MAESDKSILAESDQGFVKDGERCWFVKLEKVRLFESEGNYVRLFFEDNKPLILRTLNYLDERLDDKTFFRANRKHIVNLKWIDSIEPWLNGGLLVKLKDGQKVEVSRRQAIKFKEMLSLQLNINPSLRILFWQDLAISNNFLAHKIKSVSLSRVED